MTADQQTARAYSDNALRGAIRSLRRMFNRGDWGDRRLQALEQEEKRRILEDLETTNSHKP